MNQHLNPQGGLVKIIILIVIALLVLSYFGFNLRTLVSAPNTQDNFSLVGNFVSNIWNNYLKGPAVYLWSDIFIPLIWNPFIDNLTKMKNGQPTNVETSRSTLAPPSGDTQPPPTIH